MVHIDSFLAGTAWLSSARVVECSIHLLNERNLLHKFRTFYSLKKLILMCLMEKSFIYIYDKADN